MAAPKNDNVRERILTAARELLEATGPAQMSLADISERAGVSKGTIYYYYKNKTDIFFELTDRYLERQSAELISWTENPEKDSSVPRLVSYIVERNVADAAMRVHLINAAMLGDEVLRKKLVERYAQFEHLIAAKIAERTGSVDADYLAKLVLLASDGLIVRKAIGNESFAGRDFVEKSAEYLRNALIEK